LLVESFIPSAERVTGGEVPLAITYLLGEESMRILARIGEFVNRKGIYPAAP
jgi:hypothetical protein